MSDVTAPRPWSSGPRSLTAELEALPTPAARAVDQRLGELTAALTGTAAATTAEALEVVAASVGTDPSRLWLAHSVLAASLPSDEDVADLLVRARLGGTWAALVPVLDRLSRAQRFPQVDVRRRRVLCDVQTTAESLFLSGIQRVVRETTRRWCATQDVDLVGWTGDLTGLHDLRDDARALLLGLPAHAEEPGPRTRRPVVVPWESTLLWVEVVTDLRRTSRLLALGQYSSNTVGVLGYDSIPITSSGTVAGGMTAHFARSVAAARRSDRIAMISTAAHRELQGVLAMGAGRRDAAPGSAAVPLAAEAPATTEQDLAEARSALVVDGLPMVLVVGSHEPRKNHLAVLHAAERLWRRGVRFSVVFVGAGSWNAQDYEQLVSELTVAGRPVQSLRGLPDRLLGAAYRLARCTMFPSLNEGFGLPVAESLSVGTPVITSDFGSMKEIAAPDGIPTGALLVDPRDDDELTRALGDLLTDDQLHARLAAEAARAPGRSWDDYAAELWAYLVDGVRPGGTDPEAQPTGTG